LLLIYLFSFSCRALKTGGIEVAREKWDEASSRRGPDESMDDDTGDISGPFTQSILPDWTRMPFLAGPLSMAYLPRASQVGA
jgi:actin-related protein 10